MRRQVISQFLDFLLADKSPLHDPSKPASSTIGSLKLPATYFDPLLQTVGHLLEKSTTDDLSELDKMLLKCPDLYEKALRDGLDSKSVCAFIEKLALECESFSASLSVIILKGLNKVMFDEVRPYCDAFTILLNLKDSLQAKRMQWLLGMPQPEMICNANGFENWGLYGLNSLDDLHLNFVSSLYVENSMTILEVMTHNINRVESVCCVVLKHVLLLSFLNEPIFDYIAALPSPSYLFAKFSDWFKPFLDKYGVELNKSYFGDARKKDIHAEALKYLEYFKNKYQERFPITPPASKIEEEQEKLVSKIEEEPLSNKDPNNVAEPEESKVNQPKRDSIGDRSEEAPVLQGHLGKTLYIIGQTMNETSTEIKRTEDYIFSLKEYTVLALLSKPTGKTNLSLPRSIAREHYLFPTSVETNSPFAGFVHSKYTYSENYGKKTSKLAHFYQFFKKKLALNFGSEPESPKENKEKEDPKSIPAEASQDFKDFTEMTAKLKLFQFDCLRKYFIDNRSNKYLFVRLEITSSGEEPLRNLREIKDPVLMLVRPYSNADVIILQKADFEAPWDNYSVNLRVFNVFSAEPVIKETRLLACYMEQRDGTGDSLVIEDAGTNEGNKKGDMGKKRIGNSERNNKDNKRKMVGFWDRDFYPKGNGSFEEFKEINE